MNKKSANKRKSQPKLKPVYAAVLLAFAIESAANPMDATVVAGQASFATTGNTLTVVNTPGTIINWQSFSIGSAEITNFVQQSASSAVLNRVIGNDPSNILGTLQSNGRVFLINPHGIAFGAGSVVDVAGLVASTLNISDADFQAGRYNFTEVPGAQNISNAGNITAQDSGQIYLIAPNVENSGVITAPNGEIYLAAGSSVELVNSNDPNLRVSITAPAGDATNVGQLIASSGSLGLFGTVVKNSGTINADSATMQGGRIVFRASERVEAGGTISARGAGGGEIHVLADMQNGTVNVSGTLDASAPVSGDGGYIDTSAAHVQIADSASITTAAVNGNSGNWLIDPTDFYVSAADPLNGSSWMSNTTLSSSLGSGNVTIQTLATGVSNGDIFVDDAVSWNATTTLTLNAHRDININAAIISGIPGGANPGNLTARADLNGTGVGTINFGASGSVVLEGGAAQAVLGSANLYYNPVSYTSPTDYSAKVTANLTAAMLVNSVTQLQSINTSAFTLTQNYALGRDIDASATLTWNAGAGFQPLGDATTPFTGSLSGYAGSYTGSSYVIDGLTINTPLANSVGLFGYVGSTGKVYLVSLTNAEITGSSIVGGIAGMNLGNIVGGSVSNSSIVGGAGVSNDQVGGLVGTNSGNITSSFVTGGSVSGYDMVGGLVGLTTGGSINASHATGVIVSGHSAIGGLVGGCRSSITNSYVETGTVTATLLAGGLAGGSDPSGSIDSSYVSGTSVKLTTSVSSGMVGGLVGSNGGAIATSYVTGGSVDGMGSTCIGGFSQCVGGLVGLNGGGSITSSYATTTVANGLNLYWGLVGFDGAAGAGVTNSFWDTQTTTAGINGVGNATTSALFNSNVHGLTTAQTMTSGSVSANGFDMVNTWYLIEGNTRPFLQSEYSNTITNAHQLQLMAMNLGAIYTLGADIDMVDTSTGTGMWGSAGFVPVGAYPYWPINGIAFTGQLDGMGFTINNLTINRPATDYVGLFGGLGWGSVVSNVGLVGGSVSGLSRVGALAAYNYGSISNSYVSGMSISGCVSCSNIGGLVGLNDGLISNSYVSGGSIAGGWYVGGLVGHNWSGTIDSSHVVGGVGSSIFGAGAVGGLLGWNEGVVNNNSYVSAGNVSGGFSVGGLVGKNSSFGNINNSYVDSGTVVNGGDYVGGLVGWDSGEGVITGNTVTGTTVSGINNVGGLVGWMGSTFWVPGYIDNNHVINSFVSGGTVTGGTNIGGLVGWNGGSISNSTVSGGSVTGNWNVGGLVGYNGPYVSNGSSSFSSSPAFQGGFISNSYVATGTVVGSLGNVGGLVGRNDGKVSNAYYNVSGVSINGAYQVTSYGLYNDVLNINSVGQFDDWFDGGLLTSLNIADYAMLSGSAGSYTITSLQGMKALLGFADDAAYTFSLASNIDLATLPGYYIPYLAADFNGVNFTVSNLNLSLNNDYLGLFGHIASGSTVSNVSLLNATVTGGSNVGALAGWNEGIISNSNVTNGTIDSSVTGLVYVGGLVGWNAGSISNSFVDGTTVTAATGDAVGGLVGRNTVTIDTSYVAGSQVTGRNGVGGLVGMNSGGAGGSAGSSSAGVAGSAASISNTYVSGGTVIGNLYVGGLVGQNLGGNGGIGGYVFGTGLIGLAGGAGGMAAISNSYVSGGMVSGNSNVGGVVGQNLSGNGGKGGDTYYGTGGAGGAGGAATLSNSYVSGVTISGAVSNVGGLVGDNAIGVVGLSGTVWATGIAGAGGAAGVAELSNSFWNTDTSGSLLAAGINTGTLTNVVGLTTAQMMSMSSFTGWSIASTGGAGMTWRIYEGSTMPLLTSFLAPLTVTATAASKIYDGLAYAGGNGVTYSDINAVSGVNVLGTLVYGGTSQGAVNAGSYIIGASGLYSNQLGYDIIGYTDATLTITPAALTVTANDFGKTYDGLAYSGGNGVTYSGLVNGETSAVLGGALTYAGTSQGAINAGNYVISAGGLTSGNYSITYVDGSLTVNAAALTVTANDFGKTYDGLAYSGGNGVTYSGLVNGETSAVLGGALTYGGTSQGATNAGNYVISAGGLTSGNYSITYVDGSLTVDAAALTVSANDATKIYGDTRTYTGTEFTSSGLVNGETIGTVTLTSVGDVASANVISGPYAITVSSATGGTFSAGNYSITYVDGQLNVTPASLTIVADDLNKILTTADPLLTYTVSGLKVTDTVDSALTGELVREAGEIVGTYQIDQGTLALNTGNFASSNYTMTFTPGTFTILAPTVINEIVNISVQGNTSTDEEEKKDSPETVALLETPTTSSDPEVQSLPVCQ
jgi:filamentous hemagglutinin family protein